MTTKTFAPWVEPVAAELRGTRAEIANAARLMLPDIWGWLSPLPGWTYKDLLAHCATGDWALQEGLRAILESGELDLSRFGDVNTVNERVVAESRERSVDDLIADVEAEGEETQGLLAKLSDEHESFTPAGAPVTLGEYLRQFTGHDETHLAQLKTATDNVML